MDALLDMGLSAGRCLLVFVIGESDETLKVPANRGLSLASLIEVWVGVNAAGPQWSKMIELLRQSRIKLHSEDWSEHLK